MPGFQNHECRELNLETKRRPSMAVDLEVNENRSKKAFSCTCFLSENYRFIGVFEDFFCSFTKIATVGRRVSERNHGEALLTTDGTEPQMHADGHE